MEVIESVLEKTMFPLLLAERFQPLYGKTRFQKLTFLLQELARRKHVKGPDFEYVLYLHGPFSFELSKTIDSLVHDGYLYRSLETTRSGHEVNVFDLTRKGKDVLSIAKDNKFVTPNQVDLVRRIASRYDGYQLDDLVSEAYRAFETKGSKHQPSGRR